MMYDVGKNNTIGVRAANTPTKSPTPNADQYISPIQRRAS